MSRDEADRRWRPTPFLALSLLLHLLYPAALLVMPSHWLLLTMVLVVDHSVVVASLLLPRCALSGANLTRLPRSQGGVVLTFDDGPDAEVTPQVLELLDRYQARATFFCIGERAARQPELTAEIARRGHQLANHSHHHLHRFSFLLPRAMTEEITRCQELLARLSGQTPRWFRAPAGIRNPWLDPILRRLGLHLVSWTRRGFDTVVSDPQRVADRLLHRLAAGDILLLHDGGSARTSTGEPVVLQALPIVLAAIQERGLQTVSLPEQCACPSSEPDPAATKGGEAR